MQLIGNLDGHSTEAEKFDAGRYSLEPAVSQLNHFFSVLPNSRHTSHTALYDIDPPRKVSILSVMDSKASQCTRVLSESVVVRQG
jgi:hypothetical protein